MSDYRNHSKNSASLRQLLMSICLSRLRDTRIEEDSDNSTSYKYLLVRNVLGITFFFSNYRTVRKFPHFIRKHSSQAKRQADYRTSYSMFPLFDRKHSARGGL